MESFDENYTNAIIDKLKSIIGRDLTVKEINYFKLKRSGIAYEMIMDYISDNEKSRIDIEHYIKNVIGEAEQN